MGTVIIYHLLKLYFTLEHLIGKPFQEDLRVFIKFLFFVFPSTGSHFSGLLKDPERHTPIRKFIGVPSPRKQQGGQDILYPVHSHH